MPKAKGPRKIRKYDTEFKVRAVQLSEMEGVMVKDVAESLGIHPIMLSRWRKQARDGELETEKYSFVEPGSAAELMRLREIEKAHARLKMEHDLLKKAIRFCSEQKGKSSPS